MIRIAIIFDKNMTVVASRELADGTGRACRNTGTAVQTDGRSIKTQYTSLLVCYSMIFLPCNLLRALGSSIVEAAQ